MNKFTHYKIIDKEIKKIIQKCLLFLLLFFAVTLSGYGNGREITANSQSLMLLKQIKTEKITLNISNKPIKEILIAICKQGKVKYGIKSGVSLEENAKYSLNVTNVPIERALLKLLKETKYDYRIEDDVIVIVNREVIKPQNTPHKSSQVAVKGKIVDNRKNPVTGATVIVKNGTGGAISDEKGNFMIPSAPGNCELEVSFVGYKSIVFEVAKSDPNNIIIALEEDVMQVEDVVVNGVFERKAGTFTGSITTLKNEDLKRVSNSNALQALKNLDPSIMFYDNMEFGSDPNQLPEMSIRGKSSLKFEDQDLRTFKNDPNAPLFILDGFEVSMQKVVDLDMDRIESMYILKDASAKAIHGSKAANGVIVIELKKNTAGKLRATYNGSVELQAPDLTSYNLANAAEKLDIERAAGMYDDYNYSFNTIRTLNQLYNQRLSFVASGIDTDWIAKPLRVGVGTKHGVSVELGTQALTAIVDLSYNNVKGTMKGSDRTNLSGGVTLSYRHKKFLFKNQLTITSNVSNHSEYGSFSEYTRLNPYYTPYDANGNIAKNIVPELSDRPNDTSVGEWYGNIKFEANPLYNAQLDVLQQEKYTNITNNFELQYFAMEGLKLTLRFGLTDQKNQLDNFFPANHLKFQSMQGEDAFRRGSYLLENGREGNLSGKFDVQYNKELFKDHALYFNAGYELSEREASLNSTTAEGFPSDKMNDIMFALQYMKETKPTGREETVRETGYYLSLNYSYASKYNFDATFRQSASSMYGADSRWGAFWSTGVSWNMEKEAWLKNTAVSRMRLRATIGSTGSQSTSAYNGIASYQYFLDRTYEGFLAAKLISMKNDDLKWQDKLDKNLGFDLAIKRSLSLSFDYYHSITNNAVNPLTLAPSTGFLTVQENVGKIKNSGIDVKIRYTIWEKTADRASLSVSLGVLRNKNTLIEISDAMKNYNNQQNKLAGSTTRPVVKYYDGISMDAIWGMKSLGIDPANGNELYLAKDKEGRAYKTYKYDATQQIICGDKLPKISGNGSVNFEYKGFGVNCVFRFQYGAQMYNSTLVDKVENANMTYNVDRRIYSDRWRKPGDIVPFKRINPKGVSVTSKDPVISDKTLATSRFVQDRNELSVSSMQLSYDFYRHKFIKKMGMERMRFAINSNELFVLSSIEIERGTSYPFARSFNASLSLTF